MKKRTFALVCLYGFILVSLLFTFRLADRVAQAGPGASLGETSALSDFISGIAYRFPVWVYAVLFVALVAALRIGMNRYYYKTYASARRKQLERPRYIHINRYKERDPSFSNDAFAQLVGELQEKLLRCASQGDYAQVQDQVEPELFEKLSGFQSFLRMELLQIKLDGFLVEQGMDRISVLLALKKPRSFGQSACEWIFERESGSGEEWKLCRIQGMD